MWPIPLVVLCFCFVSIIPLAGNAQSLHRQVETCLRQCYELILRDSMRVHECLNVPRLAERIARREEAIVAFIQHRRDTSLVRYPHAAITNVTIAPVGDQTYHVRGRLSGGWGGIPFALSAEVNFDGRQCRLQTGRALGITLEDYLRNRIP
jgi:hypothetical protein